MYQMDNKWLMAEFFNAVYVPTRSVPWMEHGRELTANDFNLPYPIWQALADTWLDKAVEWKRSQNFKES